MTSRSTGYRIVSTVFWSLGVIAIVLWSLVPSYVVGWDLRVYVNAIHSLWAGHDPYLDGMAVQRVFHEQLAMHPDASPPYTYVYSPLTLPLLRWIGGFPPMWSGTLYWLTYAVCVSVTLWAGARAVEDEERPVFALLAPAAIFFPGLLQNDNFFSGNIAYILYGLILAAAVVGWRRGQWAWFYAAALAASCCKAPLLYVLAIPVLSARKQWLPACCTGVAGVALFAMQPYLWPSLFHNYLKAVELQFSYNRDFSSSPAGVLANALYDVVSYQTTSAVSYALYATIIFGVLLYLSRRFFAGYISLKQWVPVMLIGVFLLNPRIMEYDVAPLTLPMALVLWRAFERLKTRAATVTAMAAFFAVVNCAANIPAKGWRPTECFLLLGSFAVGSWNLLSQPRAGTADTASSGEARDLAFAGPAAADAALVL